MFRSAPIVPLSHRRAVVPNRPSFEFRIDEAGPLPGRDLFYIAGRVLNGAMMPGSSGLLMVHGELHGLVVKSAVLGLHEQTLKGVVTLVVQRPAFDLGEVVPGTVFASEAQAAQALAA